MPTSAFITFETDDWKELSLRYKGDDLTVLGRPMVFKDASEPTDIIWENRHFSRLDYIKREILAIVIITIVLFISFIIILLISNFSAKIA